MKSREFFVLIWSYYVFCSGALFTNISYLTMAPVWLFALIPPSHQPLQVVPTWQPLALHWASMSKASSESQAFDVDIDTNYTDILFLTSQALRHVMHAVRSRSTQLLRLETWHAYWGPQPTSIRLQPLLGWLCRKPWSAFPIASWPSRRYLVLCDKCTLTVNLTYFDLSGSLVPGVCLPMTGYVAQRAVRKMRSPSCDCQHHHRSRAEWFGLFSALSWAHFAGSEDTTKKELKKHDRLSDQNHFSLLLSSHHLHASYQSHHVHHHLHHHLCHLDLWNHPPVHQLQHLQPLRLLHLLHPLPQRLRQLKKKQRKQQQLLHRKKQMQQHWTSSTTSVRRPACSQECAQELDLELCKTHCAPDFQILWRPGAQREALPCRWFAASGELQAHRKSRQDNDKRDQLKVEVIWGDHDLRQFCFSQEFHQRGLHSSNPASSLGGSPSLNRLKRFYWSLPHILGHSPPYPLPEPFAESLRLLLKPLPLDDLDYLDWLPVINRGLAEDSFPWGTPSWGQAVRGFWWTCCHVLSHSLPKASQAFLQNLLDCATSDFAQVKDPDTTSELRVRSSRANSTVSQTFENSKPSRKNIFQTRWQLLRWRSLHCLAPFTSRDSLWRSHV